MTGRVPRWVRILLAVALLALLWGMVDGPQVLARLAGADPAWMGAAVALLMAQTLLSALRWRLVAGRLGHPMALGWALREYFLAQTVNLALPGGVAGDALRAIRAGAVSGLRQAGQAVIFERLAGQAALVVVTLVAAGWLSLRGGALPLPLAVGFALLAGACALAALVLALLRRRPAVAGWIAAARHAVLARDVLAAQAGLSLASVAANVLSFAAAAAAVGLVLPADAVFAVVPLVLFAMLVPLTVGGWGLREGASVAILPLVGATPEAALAASALFGLLFLVSSLLGAGLSVLAGGLSRMGGGPMAGPT